MNINNIYPSLCIGHWLVLEKAESRPHSTNGSDTNFWLCKCSCGEVREVNESKLKTGKSLGCGHKVAPSCKIPLVVLNKPLSDSELVLVCEMEKSKAKPKTKLIHGVGCNDSKFITSKRVDGKLFHHPAYRQWLAMLNRAYGDYQESYKSTHVCKSWLSFSNFYNWWEVNYIEGFDLDKDLLSKGESIYSAETCCYLPNWVNSLITQKYSQKFGVSLINSGYRSYCTIDGVSKYFYFTTEESAKKAWDKTIFLKISLTKNWSLIKSETVGDKYLS